MCRNCGEETTNPNFCSRSCAAKFNNHVKPKRVPEGSCCDCNTPISTRSKRCNKCRELFLADSRIKEREYKKSNGETHVCYVVDHTLADLIYGHHTSAAFALVRDRAKKVVATRPKICTNCGYSKHVETCHIKAITSFPMDTLISVVNDPSNLILLCPNCHWEFDHGLLVPPVGFAPTFG